MAPVTDISACLSASGKRAPLKPRPGFHVRPAPRLRKNGGHRLLRRDRRGQTAGRFSRAARVERLVEKFHIDLGIITGDRWKLSEMIQTAIAAQDQPERAGPYEDMVNVVSVADNIAALLDACPFLLPRDFEKVPGVRTQREIDALMTVVPFIPGYITHLNDMSPETKESPGSAISERPSVMGPECIDTDLEVTQIRSVGDTPLRCIAISPEAMAVESSRPMPEGNVTRIRINPQDPSLDQKQDRQEDQTQDRNFETSGRIVLCRPNDNGYYVEVRLFGLNETGKRDWDTWFQQKESRDARAVSRLDKVKKSAKQFATGRSSWMMTNRCTAPVFRTTAAALLHALKRPRWRDNLNFVLLPCHFW